MTNSNVTINDALAKWVLLLSSVAIFFCFVLITIANQYYQSLILLGALLAIPGIISIKKSEFYQIAHTVNLVALVGLVLIASNSVWQSVLSKTVIDLPLNLLVLTLILVLSLVWQLLAINNKKHAEDMTLNQLIDYARKNPSIPATLALGLIMSDLALLIFSILPDSFNYISVKIIDRGIIPPITITLFFWGMLLLLVKYVMLSIEKNQPANYLNKLEAKLSGTDQDKRTVLNLLWNQFETFYTVPHYINWAIPILGFIGTVLGISLATEKLGIALSDNAVESGQLLSSALTPLGIAFDTTLVALSLSVILALLQTLLYRSEAKYLATLEERFK